MESLPSLAPVQQTASTDAVFPPPGGPGTVLQLVYTVNGASTPGVAVLYCDEFRTPFDTLETQQDGTNMMILQNASWKLMDPNSTVAINDKKMSPLIESFKQCSIIDNQVVLYHIKKEHEIMRLQKQPQTRVSAPCSRSDLEAKHLTSVTLQYARPEPSVHLWFT